jgi:hypothetical protein
LNYGQGDGEGVGLRPGCGGIGDGEGEGIGAGCSGVACEKAAIGESKPGGEGTGDDCPMEGWCSVGGLEEVKVNGLGDYWREGSCNDGERGWDKEGEGFDSGFVGGVLALEYEIGEAGC